MLKVAKNASQNEAFHFVRHIPVSLIFNKNFYDINGYHPRYYKSQNMVHQKVVH